jgi:predicted nucleic acid-binding protein
MRRQERSTAQSHVVREAIREYEARSTRLSDEERARMLAVVDRPLGPAPGPSTASVIHLDTSVLVDALTGPRRSAPALRAVLDRGERIAIATLVLYEWLHGPRRHAELAHQEALLPAAEAVPFGPREAALAAAVPDGPARAPARARPRRGRLRAGERRRVVGAERP